MTLDDYKELMKFHLLLSDEDISNMNYAAVDRDGLLCVYGSEPSNENTFNKITKLLSENQWTPREEIDDRMTGRSNFIFIARLSEPEDWKQTLMEL